MENRGNRRILISGHRGTRVHAIENTANAFEYCLKNHIDAIEFDVRATKDHKVVIFHDGQVNRLLNGSGSIEQMQYADLKKLKYADDQTIQTLDEFFAQVGKQIIPILEIKTRAIGDLVMDAVHHADYRNNEIIIQSFSAEDVVECYKIDPQYDYALCMGPVGKYTLFHSKMAKLVYSKFIAPYSVKWLNLDGPFLYDTFMDEVTAHGLHIILGAMRTTHYLRNLDRWKVEMINCNDPVLIRNLVAKRGYQVNI